MNHSDPKAETSAEAIRAASQTRCVNRFVEVAQRGSHPAASSGERTANKLARALHSIGDDLAVLDDGLLEGALLLARLMAGPWKTDEQKETIFNSVRRAAGKGRNTRT